MTITEQTHTLWLNPLTGGTELVPHAQALDARDCDTLRRIFSNWNERTGPRVGDYVRFADGTLRRFSHDWDEYGLQTSDGGSWYFGNGFMSFSGSLYPCTPRESLTLTSETRNGRAWFFHHDIPGGGRGVTVTVPCRVYQSTENANA